MANDAASSINWDDMPPLEFGDPPAEFFQALGRLVYEFGKLDSKLESLICYSTSVEEVNQVSLLTSGESTDWLLHKLRIIASSGHSSLLDTEQVVLGPLISDARDLLAKRNRFVHADWYYHPNTDELHGFRDRRHREADEFGTDVDSINRLAIACHELNDAIEEIRDRLSRIALRKAREQHAENPGRS